jgi:phosphoribosylformimino-5-aminoimidazole carboxamide ribotide isomerase
MLLIPTIQIKGGKCTPVTAIHGRGKSDAIDNPAMAAREWIAVGVRRLHVVNMDGAQSGKKPNAAILREIVDACVGVPVQVGGSLRNDTDVENCMDAGVEYVILGTKAASTPHYINNLCLEYPGHILVELDTKDGKVHTEGWSKLAGHEVQEVAQHFQREGVAGILYNDKHIGGPRVFNITSALSLAQAVTIPVILVNGPGSGEGLKQLHKAAAGGLAGAMVSLQIQDFAEAQKLADTYAQEFPHKT